MPSSSGSLISPCRCRRDQRSTQRRFNAAVTPAAFTPGHRSPARPRPHTPLHPHACPPNGEAAPPVSTPPVPLPFTAPTPSESPLTPSSSSSHLRLSSGAFVLPHPSKAAKGGEDWYFLAKSQRAVGIADGVGGWAGVGIDAGAYARQLMRHACDIADIQASSGCTSSSDRDELEAALVAAEVAAAGGSKQRQRQRAAGGGSAASMSSIDDASEEEPLLMQLSAQEIVQRAYDRTNVRGSCTVCVAVLNGKWLQATNLGDSGLLVVRGNDILLATTQQQHSFNFPFQIGGDRLGDTPHVADRYELQVAAGDAIVLGTDGLWDNCFNDEIVAVIKHCQAKSFSPSKSARVLGMYARRRASDGGYESPFALTARQAGIDFLGGKMDDISVVVSYVEAGEGAKYSDESEAAPGEEPGWAKQPSSAALWTSGFGGP